MGALVIIACSYTWHGTLRPSCLYIHVHLYNMYMYIVNTVGGVEFCEDEIDDVWEIQWPNTLVGETATVPCGVDFIGNDIYMWYGNPSTLCYISCTLFICLAGL